MSGARLRIVADVGGTNTRLALYDEGTGHFVAQQDFLNRHHLSLEALIKTWKAQHGIDCQRACLAIAAPLTGDQIAMINIDWRFSRSQFCRDLSLHQCLWLNDFAANAHALPGLSNSDTVTLNAGEPTDNAPLAVIGPGTGLGGATAAFDSAGQWQVRPAEPGMSSLAPANSQELELFGALLKHYPDIYAELLLSGPGLVRLYQTMAEQEGCACPAREPEAISAAYGEDKLCTDVVSQFCALLGSICGDFVLATGAFGGLYLAGGIAPKLLRALESEQFLQRFSAKGALQQQLSAVPIHVITHPRPGLIGAARALI